MNCQENKCGEIAKFCAWYNLCLHKCVLKEIPQHLQNNIFHNLREGHWIYYLGFEEKENWELN